MSLNLKPYILQWSVSSIRLIVPFDNDAAACEYADAFSDNALNGDPVAGDAF